MRHKILTVVGAFILLGIIGNALGSDDNTATTTSSTNTQVETGSPATQPVEKAYKVGEIIKTDDLEITVQAADNKAKVGSEYFTSKPSEGGTYIAVQWKFKNISDKPISSFEQPQIKLVDAGGTEYDSDLGATSSFATELKLDSKIVSDLNPGIAVKDAEVFEVSKDSFTKAGWKVLIKAGGKDIPVTIK